MKKKLIVCLPVAGIENPYQKLMMDGLNESDQLHAINGIDDRFFGIIRSALKYRPEYLHFDWIVSYYYRRWKWFTWLSVPSFFLQIWAVKYLFGVRVVWTLHNISPHDLHEKRIHIFCQRFLAENCSWIRVFSTQSIKEASSTLKRSVDNFKIVAEGSYTEYYPHETDAATAREKLNIDSNKRVLLFLGYVRPYKGVLEMISAYKKVRRGDSLLVIAGKIMDREYGQLIAESLEEDIILTDSYIEKKDLQYYFEACDIVVLPFNKIENSGSVILAMGFSKPVIAPNVGAIRSRLAHQKSLLFGENSLEEKIDYSLKMSNLELKNIGQENLNLVNKYKWTDFQHCFDLIQTKSQLPNDLATL